MTLPALRRLDMKTDFIPSTPDPERLPLPERSLLYIQKLVSLPLQFLAVDREIQKGWPSGEKGEDTSWPLALHRYCTAAMAALHPTQSHSLGRRPEAQ